MTKKAKDNLEKLIEKKLKSDDLCDSIKNDIVTLGFSIIKVNADLEFERLSPRNYLRGGPCTQTEKSKK